MKERIYKAKFTNINKDNYESGEMAKVINENRYGDCSTARATQQGDTLLISVDESEAEILETHLRSNWALVELKKL